MPTSTAGITQYFDEYKSKLVIAPGHVIILIVIVIALVLLLQVYGGSLLG